MPTAATTVIPTLANLQTAFNGESNAAERYSEFARKADAEGFHKVASLFRAAAWAEQVHANNHAVVIRKMGDTPKADIEAPVVNSTPENLKVAIAGEEYERDVMYPDFIKAAEREANAAAVRTFRHALEAETEHARLYVEALAHLDEMKVKTVYYVCPMCGYTVEKPGFDRCPVCRHPRDKFEEVS